MTQAHAIEVARRLETVLDGMDAALVVDTCCWLLADLVLQAEKEHGMPAGAIVGYVTQQLLTNLAAIRAGLGPDGSPVTH